MKNKNTISAFTLIELLVVIVIIGILATIGIGTFNGYKEKAENAKALMASSNAKKKLLINTVESEGNLTAYYSFEGDDVDEVNDTIVDRSGSGNNLYLAEDSGYSVSDDALGGGKSLKMEPMSNFRISSPIKNSPGPAEEITLSTLVKFNATSGLPYIFGADRTGIRGETYSNRFVFSFINNGVILRGTTEIQKDKWYHVAVTFSEATDTVRLYVNGRLDAERTGYTGTIYTDFGTIFLAFWYDVNQAFDGWIDETIIAPFVVDFD